MLKRSFIHMSPWTTIIILLLFLTYHAKAVDLSVEDAFGVPGGNVTVQILIDDAVDILSADITLSYDPGTLHPTGAETTSLTSDSMVAHTINWGAISISFACDTALTGESGALVEVPFSISEYAEGGETPIIISDATVYGSDYKIKDLTTVDGKVIISNTTSSTTTTIGGQFCPSALIYGEQSEETGLLRYFRDAVLSQTPEGQELIRLYYEWSPVIVEMMNEDEKFKEQVKEMADGVLPLIR